MLNPYAMRALALAIALGIAVSASSTLRIAPQDIQRHLSAIRYGCRLAGSEGEAKTLRYAEAQLRSLGAQNVRREPFLVTIPDPEAKATLTFQLGSKTETIAELLPLWPNLVRTSTCDIAAPAIFCETGSREELSGKEVKGRVVFMNWLHADNWQVPAQLGAKAIVFLARGSTAPDRYILEQAFSSVPLDVPRFVLFAPSELAKLGGNKVIEQVKIRCRQEWVTRETYNLIAEFSGSSNEPGVMLSAYADAMSIVPGASPGAEQGTGLASLLEIVRHLTAQPNRRTLTVVVSSAHGLGLQGMREFSARRLDADPQPMLAAITLDFSSGQPRFGMFGRGWMYDYREETQDTMRGLARAARSLGDDLAKKFNEPESKFALLDAINQSDGRTWKNTIPGVFAVDAEPLVLAGYPAITLKTADDACQRVDTPNDRLEFVNFAAVARQAEAGLAIVDRFLNAPLKPPSDGGPWIASEPQAPSRFRLTGGFGELVGRVVRFDPKRHFIADEPAPNSLAVMRHTKRSLMGVRGDIVVATQGEDARYRLVGAATSSSYWIFSQRPVHIGAYHLHPKSGEVVAMPNLGAFGARNFPTEFNMTVSVKESPIVLMDGTTLAMFGLFDPQWREVFPAVVVLDGIGNGEPTEYGLEVGSNQIQLNPNAEDVAVAMVRPAARVSVLGYADYGSAAMVLAGVTPQDLLGRGFAAQDADVFRDPAIPASREVITLNSARLAKLAHFRMIDDSTITLHRQSESALRAAEQALAARDWVQADIEGRKAWGLALTVHPMLRDAANDAVRGATLLLFFAGPLGYILERLLFGSRQLARQLIGSSAIFLALFGLIRWLHPAFAIVANPSMVLVAFAMGILSVLVIAFLVAKFENTLRELRQGSPAAERPDVARLAVAGSALSLGLGNMRRRPVRAALTSLTLISATFIVQAFTSVVPAFMTRAERVPGEANYLGMLFRSPGFEPRQSVAIKTLKPDIAALGATRVATRAWYYGADINEQSAIELGANGTRAPLRTLLGMEAAEAELTKPQRALIAGRWFDPGERGSILIPTDVAKTLGLDSQKIGKAKVELAGQTYTLIGIFDPAKMATINDLDGEGIVPADFAASRRLQNDRQENQDAFRKHIRFDPKVMAIISTADALRIGADIRSIAFGFEDPAKLKAAMDDLMPRSKLNVYATDATTQPWGTERYSAMRSAKTSGLGAVAIPLLLAMGFIVSAMVASVMERRREIATLGAVGLAPAHIGTLFLAESFALGVIGLVLGSVLSLAAAAILASSGALPGLTLNFSGSSSLLATGLVLGMALLSAIYPSWLAKRLMAPAFDDSENAPLAGDDVWLVRMPFALSSTEIDDLTRYLGDWLAAHALQAAGGFVSEAVEIVENGTRPEAQALVWLAPYDLGVSQRIRLHPVMEAGGILDALVLEITRTTGEHRHWVSMNRRFIESVRQQGLAWRTRHSAQSLRQMGKNALPKLNETS